MKDKTIDHVLRATWQAVAKMYNEVAAKSESTMATGFTLLSIDPDKGSPSTALGPKMGMEATSLSRILKNMEEKGLITRKPNPEDGRGVIISLTDFGKEKREVSKTAVLTFNDVVRSHVTAQDLSGFYKVNQVINELISERKIFNQEESKK